MALKDLVGTELAGFSLTSLIGHGGMATVFRGESTIDKTILRAIKVVKPELASRDEFLARFAEEARILERLHHPGVVRFFGARRDQGYLVMELELLEGQSLADWAHRRLGEPVPFEQLIRWTSQAARGVAAAHALGIVHRDIKPDNLFLTRDGGIKVLDFGIARAIDETDRATVATVAGTVPGSPAYMAPEVCEGRVPSAAADVYALGVCMLELGLGYHPLCPPGSDKLSSTQLMFAHVRGGLPSLNETRADAPERLVAIIDQAVATRPEERFDSAASLAAALEPLLDGASVAPPARAPVEEPQTAFKLPTLGELPPPAGEKQVAPGAPSETEFQLPKLQSTADAPEHGAEEAPEPLLAKATPPAEKGKGLRWLLGTALFLALVIGAVFALGLLPLKKKEDKGPTSERSREVVVPSKRLIGEWHCEETGVSLHVSDENVVVTSKSGTRTLEFESAAGDMLKLDTGGGPWVHLSLVGSTGLLLVVVTGLHPGNPHKLDNFYPKAAAKKPAPPAPKEAPARSPSPGSSTGSGFGGK